MCPLSRGPPACPGSEWRRVIGYPRRDPVGPQGGVACRPHNRSVSRPSPGRGRRGSRPRRRPSSSCGASATRSSSSPGPARGRASPTRPTRRPARAVAARTRCGPATSSSRSTPRPTRRSPGCATARSWPAWSARRSTPTSSRSSRPAGSPPWPWTPCRASRRAQSLDVLSRWPTSPATARSSRPPTSSARSSPARSPRPARCRRPRCSSSAPASPGSPRSAPPAASAPMVRAFDARPEVGEQVESMGAEFLRVERSEEESQASRRRLRQGDVARTSTARPPSCMPRRPPTSTSSSPPR